MDFHFFEKVPLPITKYLNISKMLAISNNIRHVTVQNSVSFLLSDETFAPSKQSKDCRIFRDGTTGSEKRHLLKHFRFNGAGMPVTSLYLFYSMTSSEYTTTDVIKALI